MGAAEQPAAPPCPPLFRSWTAEDDAEALALGIANDDEGIFDDGSDDDDYESDGDAYGGLAGQAGGAEQAGAATGGSASAWGGLLVGGGEAEERERRWFRVTDVLRAGGDFRPSFVLAGDVIEARGGDGCAAAAAAASAAPRPQPQPQPPPPPESPAETIADSDSEHQGGAAGEDGHVGAPAAVIAAGLTLALRYEPPSPKFTRLRPRAASYRLSVRRGDDFLYSSRGLAPLATYDRGAATVVWGELRLVFAGGEAAMSRFIDALKYVDVVEERVSGAVSSDQRATVRPRDGGARATAEVGTQTLPESVEEAPRGVVVAGVLAGVPPGLWQIAASMAFGAAAALLLLRRR